MGTAVLSCSWFSSDYSPCTFTSYNVVVLFLLEPSPIHDSTIFCLAVLLLTNLFWHIFVVINRCNIQGILSFHACISVIAMLLKCTTGYHCKLWHLLFHWLMTHACIMQNPKTMTANLGTSICLFSVGHIYALFKDDFLFVLSSFLQSIAGFIWENF